MGGFALQYWALQYTYYIRPHYQDRVIAGLPNTHKRIQGGWQNEETNVAQRKEQIKTIEKEQNKREISNLADAYFKSLIIRMLK